MTSAELVPLAIPAGLAVFGYLIKSSVNSVNDRLKSLEAKLENAVERLTATMVRQDTTVSEIEKLRLKVHAMESELVAVATVQERCLDEQKKARVHE